MTEPRMTHDDAVELAAAYVLGALERSEEAAVRDHLATCALAHPEFEAFGGVVPAFLGLDDLELVEPPAALGDRIMAAAAADLAANPRAAAGAPAPAQTPVASAPASAPAPTAPSAPVAFPSAAERTLRAERARTSRFDWALRIAAVLAIVAVGAWGLNLQSQLDASRRFDQAVAAVVSAGSQPGAKTVVLATQANQHGAGIGAVNADGSVVLALRDLTATSGQQSYTAWVIVGKSAPVNVGDFSVDASGVRAFTTKPVETPAGAIIAVTLEANPGNPAPGGPIVIAGPAAAPPAPTS